MKEKKYHQSEISTEKRNMAKNVTSTAESQFDPLFNPGGFVSPAQEIDSNSAAPVSETESSRAAEALLSSFSKPQSSSSRPRELKKNLFSDDEEENLVFSSAKQLKVKIFGRFCFLSTDHESFFLLLIFRPPFRSSQKKWHLRRHFLLCLAVSPQVLAWASRRKLLMMSGQWLLYIFPALYFPHHWQRENEASKTSSRRFGNGFWRSLNGWVVSSSGRRWKGFFLRMGRLRFWLSFWIWAQKLVIHSVLQDELL